MKLSNLIIGLIMFFVMIMAGSNLLQYSSNINSGFIDSVGYNTFQSVFDKHNTMNESISRIEATLQNKNPSILDPLSFIYQSAVFMLSTLYSSIQFVFTMAWDIPRVLGFNSELTPFIWGLVLAISVGVLFAIFSATLYREI